MHKIIAQTFLILIITIPFTNADNITIAADTWCPINCEVNSQYEGFMVHMARVIFSKAGHSIEYKVMPWSRALSEVKAGNINGAIGASIDECTDCIFPQHEQGMVSLEMFTKKQDTWRYDGLASLKGKTLAVIADYAYSDELDAYIKRHKNNRNIIQVAFGNDPLERVIKKLSNDRVDVAIETGEVFWYTANKLNLKDQFSAAGLAFEAEKIYIAFTPETEKSQEYANILSEGMKELRRSGELQRIMELYGLDDWK